jgi:hypothetical protein
LIAAAAMSGSSILVMLNALRARRAGATAKTARSWTRLAAADAALSRESR